MKEVVFYYDVVCPFAYMASRLIEGVASRNGAKILWKPVLLGNTSHLQLYFLECLEMVSRAIFTYICYIRVGRAIRFLFLTIGSLAEVLRYPY